MTSCSNALTSNSGDSTMKKTIIPDAFTLSSIVQTLSHIMTFPSLITLIGIYFESPTSSSHYLTPPSKIVQSFSRCPPGKTHAPGNDKFKALLVNKISFFYLLWIRTHAHGFTSLAGFFVIYSFKNGHVSEWQQWTRFKIQIPSTIQYDGCSYYDLHIFIVASLIFQQMSAQSPITLYKHLSHLALCQVPFYLYWITLVYSIIIIYEYILTNEKKFHTEFHQIEG